jgi:hypothetical protein
MHDDTVVVARTTPAFHAQMLPKIINRIDVVALDFPSHFLAVIVGHLAAPRIGFSEQTLYTRNEIVASGI